LAVLGVWGCTKHAAPAAVEASSPNGSGAESTHASSDAPSFGEAERKILLELSPASLPPPPADVTNALAESPSAAAFGLRLFGERSFAGPLLDQDNDGGPNTLGKRGETAKVSCSDCHMPSSGFSDTRSVFREISLGSGWTARRAPSLLDVAQAKLVAWGGRHSTLFGQIFAPLENPLEMNTSRLYVARYLFDHYKDDYESVFGKRALDALRDSHRFPIIPANLTGCSLTREMPHPRAQPPDALYSCHGMPGDRAEYDGMSKADQDLVTRVVANMGKAIAAYERTLRCGSSRFDRWVHGASDALSTSEQRGAKLFIGGGRCVTCHLGPYLTDQKFYNVGVEEKPTRERIFNHDDRGAAVDLPLAAKDPLGSRGPYSDGDDGRVPASVPSEYEGAFRTPGLRCVSQRPSFMHTGLVPTLDGAVAHFVRGGSPTGHPGTSVLSPLRLTAAELADLVAFLRSLDAS
jgi:cytochrome c peroxidase